MLWIAWQMTVFETDDENSNSELSENCYDDNAQNLTFVNYLVIQRVNQNLKDFP